MSCELDLGIQDVVERCWQELQLMRIYTKKYAPFNFGIMLSSEADLSTGRETSPILVRLLSSEISRPSRKYVIKSIGP